MVGTIKRQSVARIILVCFLGLMLLPFSGIGTAHADTKKEGKKETSETTVAPQDDKGSGDTFLDDMGVTMDKDGGTVSITGLDEEEEGSWNTIFKKYKVVILGVSGILTLTFVILFGRSIVKLAANSDNPQGRREAIQSILWTFVAMALFGSITLVTGLAWNSLK